MGDWMSLSFRFESFSSSFSEFLGACSTNWPTLTSFTSFLRRDIEQINRIFKQLGDILGVVFIQGQVLPIPSLSDVVCKRIIPFSN